MLLLIGILIVVLLFAAALNGSRAANEIRALRRQQWLQAERERLKAEDVEPISEVVRRFSFASADVTRVLNNSIPK